LAALAALPLAIESEDMAIMAAIGMVLMQFADALVGARAGDKQKTIGPAVISIANLGCIGLAYQRSITIDTLLATGPLPRMSPATEHAERDELDRREPLGLAAFAALSAVQMPDSAHSPTAVTTGPGCGNFSGSLRRWLFPSRA
jgi:hypothetical protein